MDSKWAVFCFLTPNCPITTPCHFHYLPPLASPTSPLNQSQALSSQTWNTFILLINYNLPPLASPTPLFNQSQAPSSQTWNMLILLLNYNHVSFTPIVCLLFVCLYVYVCVCMCVYVHLCVCTVIYAWTTPSSCVDMHIFFFSTFFYDIHYLNVHVCILSVLFSTVSHRIGAL